MGQFYIMYPKKSPTIINCVEELKKFCICGSGKNLYISNLMPLKIVETFIAIMDEEMENEEELAAEADAVHAAAPVSNPNAPQYVLVRPSEFNDAISVAIHVIAHKTVVLNLDNTGKEIARRILDFMAGATYASDGKIARVSSGTYIITPKNVDMMGSDMMDELENSGLFF